MHRTNHTQPPMHVHAHIVSHTQCQTHTHTHTHTPHTRIHAQHFSIPEIIADTVSETSA